MKHPFYLILFVLLIDLSFQKCANPGRPTGGPKDTIPPTLIYANPINGTTNFNQKTIELEFSEYVNADKLRQQLIITPRTDINYKSIIKRNRLIIKLEGDLEDSTTYNFNFANGVTDITEKNPVVNLSIAFSTGPFIDSMSVKGSVEDLLTQEPGKEYVVGLYPLTDSLDYFSDKPLYFASANDSGNYQLQYIKRGKYKIIAFDDDNGNFLLDPESESHGFLADTIHLDSATQLETIRCVLQNVKPLALINTRSVGRYVEVKFNKMINSYSISNQNIPNNIIGENSDVIRLYKTPAINFGDSITTYVQASDSLGNSVTDTIKYVFLESNRKPSGFSYSINESKIEIRDNPSVNIQFNKPIHSFDTTKIQITADTILSYRPAFMSLWNPNKTQLLLTLNVSANLIDSLINETIPKDTTQQDSVSNFKTKGKLGRQPDSQPTIDLEIIKGAFISIEQDSTTAKSIPFAKPSSKPGGVLKVQFNTEINNFLFQLIDSNDKVAYQQRSMKDLNFSAVKPGKYRIRVLIDNNGDGKWSYGNLLKNIEPEEVYLYPEEQSVRENWVVEMSITL